MGLQFLFCYSCLQPAIAGGLGPIPNVSASPSHAVERTDRIPQPMSLGNLVMISSISIYFFHCYVGLF